MCCHIEPPMTSISALPADPALTSHLELQQASEQPSGVDTLAAALGGTDLESGRLR